MVADPEQDMGGALLCLGARRERTHPGSLAKFISQGAWPFLALGAHATRRKDIAKKSQRRVALASLTQGHSLKGQWGGDLKDVWSTGPDGAGAIAREPRGEAEFFWDVGELVRPR